MYAPRQVERVVSVGRAAVDVSGWYLAEKSCCLRIGKNLFSLRVSLRG